MKRALLTPRARRELAAATEWISRDSRAAALGLRKAVDRALEVIGSPPDIGVARPELATDPVRFYVLSGYPYLLVYTPAHEPPVVMRVLHGARGLEQALAGPLTPSPRRS